LSPTPFFQLSRCTPGQYRLISSFVAPLLLSFVPKYSSPSLCTSSRRILLSKALLYPTPCFFFNPSFCPSHIFLSLLNLSCDIPSSVFQPPCSPSQLPVKGFIFPSQCFVRLVINFSGVSPVVSLSCVTAWRCMTLVVFPASLLNASNLMKESRPVWSFSPKWKVVFPVIRPSFAKVFLKKRKFLSRFSPGVPQP